MKKFYFLVILLCAVSISSYSQSAEDKDVAAVVEKLMKGIVDADKSILQDITAEDLFTVIQAVRYRTRLNH